MEIRKPSTQNGAKLTDFMGEIIGLLFDGVVTQVNTVVEGENTTLYNVVRARLYHLDPATYAVEDKGTSLIFQTVIAQNLLANPESAEVGRLRKVQSKNDAERSYFTLDGEDLNWDRIEAAFATV